MIDTYSKNLVIRFLKLSAAFDSEEISPYESWDISTDFNGHRIGLEVKNREGYDSTGFLKDINSCEESKVIANRELIENGTFDVVLLVSLFGDGILRVNDIMQSYDQDVHESPKSTYYDGRRIRKVYANFRDFKDYRYVE